MVRTKILFSVILLMLPVSLLSRTIVFDLNGTVLKHQKQIWCKVARELAATHHFRLPETDTELFAKPVGIMVQESGCSLEDWVLCTQAVWKEYYASQDIELYKPILPILEALSQRYTLAVMSSNPAYMQQVLKQTGLDQYFTKVWGVPPVTQGHIEIKDGMFHISTQTAKLVEHASNAKEAPIFVVQFADLANILLGKHLHVVGVGWGWHPASTFAQYAPECPCAATAQELLTLVNRLAAKL